MLNKKVALIAGITGQDGFYLSKLLIHRNYKIIGLSKRISSKTPVTWSELTPAQKARAAKEKKTKGRVSRYKPNLKKKKKK